MSSQRSGRARSASIVKVEEVGTSEAAVLDQSAYPNMNVEWVNQKGPFSVPLPTIR
jgi:hypothetical protein